MLFGGVYTSKDFSELLGDVHVFKPSLPGSVGEWRELRPTTEGGVNLRRAGHDCVAVTALRDPLSHAAGDAACAGMGGGAGGKRERKKERERKGRMRIFCTTHTHIHTLTQTHVRALAPSCRASHDHVLLWRLRCDRLGR